VRADRTGLRCSRASGVTINNVTGAANRRSVRAFDNDAGLPTNVLEALAQFNANNQALMDDLQQLPFLSAADIGNPAVSSARCWPSSPP
jgi:hypothetical protein